MRKKVLKILLPSLLLMLSLCTAAWAANGEIDMGYIGPLDTFTGAPTQSTGADGAVVSNGNVWINTTVQYNAAEQMYVYPVNGSAYTAVRADVMDGMITNRAVEVVPDEGVQITLFRNGEVVGSPDLSNITAVGEYVVASGTGDQSGDRIFSFTIIGEYSNAVKNYRMPDSFQLTDVTCNGESVYFTRGNVDLSAEGEYYIEYRCVKNDRTYKLNYTADFTPPELKLEAVENGMAAGAVDLSDLEPGAGLGIWLEGEQIGNTAELTRSGNYVVKVADAAGNVNTYDFVIRVYFDNNSLVFFFLIVAVLAATGIYVLVSRKNLRVR